MENEKRTKDLTEEEILKFDRAELKQWMKRVLARLFTLVDKDEYIRLSTRFVLLCERGIGHAKKGLIELVNVIKANWHKSHLTVVK